MKKQLKIWKEDFLRYYSRTSIIMRIVIGAGLGAVAALFLTNRIIKPQNAELKVLKQNYQTMEVIDDVSIQMADLKNKQRKTQMQLDALQELNEQLISAVGSLSKGEIGKNILALRSLIDRHKLRIVSEERVIPAAKLPTRRRAGKKPAADPRVQIKFPATMACESYKFEVLGSYQDLRKFLMDVRNSGALVFLNNISIRQSQEMLTDKNLNQYRALSCTFEVHIPYRKEQKNMAGKK